MKVDALAQALEKTEQELREERASALGRAGRLLEALIAQLHTLRAEIEALPEEARAPRLQEYREIHRQAKYRFWCLMVQREAVGLRQHRELEVHYPIPPPI